MSQHREGGGGGDEDYDKPVFCMSMMSLMSQINEWKSHLNGKVISNIFQLMFGVSYIKENQTIQSIY